MKIRSEGSWVYVSAPSVKLADELRFFNGVEQFTGEWKVPKTPRLIKHLSEYTHLQRNLRKYYKKHRQRKYPSHLYDFQYEGVRYIAECDGNLLLADDMGLGKTNQLLTWLDEFKKLPAVIVVPAYLRYNWQEEAAMWTKLTTQIITKGKDKLHKADLYIISYDLLSTFEKQFRKLKVQTYSADEAHYLKSSKAKRSKTFKKLSRKSKHTILMTGTPITSKTENLWNILNIINHRVWRSKRQFQFRYCDPKLGARGYEFKGCSHTEELHANVKLTGFLRRRKEDVLKELPGKIRSVLPVDITNRSTYNKARSGIVSYLKAKGLDDKANSAANAETICQLTELRKLAGIGKVKAVIQWVKDQNEEGKHVLIFGVHKESLKQLYEAFKSDSGLIIGNTSTAKRKQLKNAFQAGELMNLFGNVDSMGTGLTLTKAYTVLFFEYPWEPAKLDQAEDRVYRIGQTMPVEIIYMVGLHTIDQKMVELNDKKRINFRQVIDDGKVTPQDSIISTLVSDLLKGG